MNLNAAYTSLWTVIGYFVVKKKKEITWIYLNPVTRGFKKKDMSIALALIRLSLLSRSRSQTVWPSVEFRREICEWALVTRAFWMETDGPVFTRAALCSGTGCGCGRRGCMLIFILFNSFFSSLEEIRGEKEERILPADRLRLSKGFAKCEHVLVCVTLFRFACLLTTCETS